MVRSPLQTALLIVGVVAIAVLAAVIGLPQAVGVLFASTVGGGLLISDANRRREARARALAGDTIEGFPLQVPAERVAVGRSMQFRLLSPTREVWAPGLLCIRRGEARFVPAKERHRSRAWAGPVSSSEVTRSRAVAIVRLHGPEGSAQFVVQRPPVNLDEAVPAWLETPTGAGGPAAQ